MAFPQKMKICFDSFLKCRCTHAPKWMHLLGIMQAHIAFIVDRILEEPIELLRNNRLIKSKPSVFRERILLSNKPNVCSVVRAEMYRHPLLLLQAKKPVKKGSSLSTQTKQLDEAFDTAQSFKAHESEISSIVVTSFGETFVCWNSNDKSTTKLYNNECFQQKQNPTPY